MKVALIDNMNNNFFALARYFRDLGIETDLYLIPGRDHSHFDPQEDTWYDLKTQTWIKEFPFSYHAFSYIRPIQKSLLDSFSEYDKIIACGSSLGLLHRAGISVDLFIPYGSDLYNLPFPNHNSAGLLKRTLRFPLEEYRAALQKNGIKQSRIIIVNTNWSVAKQALEEMQCTAVNLPRIMIYKEYFPDSMKCKYAWLEDYDFTVFSPTRHLWATNADSLPDFSQNGGTKRNDKLISAFAKLIESKVARRPLLLLCDYGADVFYSKKLIINYRIEEFVKWIPLLPRKEVSLIMSSVSVVADQFRVGMSATSAGTTNEALAAGKPIITNTDGALHDVLDPYYFSPILQALSEGEIFDWLIKLCADPYFTKSVGAAGAKWFDENLGFSLAQRYIDLLMGVQR